MRNSFLFIMFGLILIAVSCRASRNAERSERLAATSATGLAASRVDSLLAVLSERKYIHIEYYEPRDPEILIPSREALSLSDTSSSSSGLGLGANAALGGGRVPVKSIEIRIDRDAAALHSVKIDTSAVLKKEHRVVRQEHKAFESRHDNGAVFIVFIVAATAAIAYLLIKKWLK